MAGKLSKMRMYMVIGPFHCHSPVVMFENPGNVKPFMTLTRKSSSEHQVCELMLTRKLY